MKNYNKNELIIKNNYELYEIAKKENILGKYNFDINRDKLIKNILKNNEYKYNKKIEEYLETGYYSIQDFFEKNLRVLEFEKFDIVIEDVTIYKEITSKIIININKNKNLDLNIVFLVNEYRYIYGIFSSKILDVNYDYYKCELTLIPELNRFMSEYNNERLFFSFFEDSSDLYNIYYNKYKSEVLNESIYGYIAPIIKYRVIHKVNNIENIYVKLGIDNVSSKYLKEDFCIDVSNLEDNISLNYGTEAKEILKENNYKTNRSFFTKIDDVIYNNNSLIVIKDENLNSKMISFNELFLKFMKFYINKIEYQIKSKINKVFILKNDNENINNILSYECYHNLKYFIGKDREYTYILSDFKCFKIIFVKHNVINNKISYKLKMSEQVIHENIYLTEMMFLNTIMEYILNDKKSLFNHEGNIFNFMKDNRNFEIKISNDYSIYVREEAKNLMNMYYNNECFDYKKDLDDIIVYLSFKSIYDFFENFKILDILKKFNDIKLNGRLVHTKYFIEVLKEFIPGKILEYRNTINEKEIFDIIDDYESKRDKGNLILEYKYIELKYDINLSYINYLGEKIKIISLYENKINFIDKDNNTIFIEIIIEKIYQYKNNELSKLIINFPHEYIELDENELLYTDELGIKDFEIDEVINDVVRIFLSFESKNILRLFFVKRIEDQIFCSFDSINLP
ncbi:hypothetical protein [Streptobacillus moniliformis]|uniref:hypothetical protein n=1 Tax=Streptobacillus moniliformis TaxID=34105 RepID=UPI0007E40AB5|nr:hypothetical protein [Streptobacillus moniliformis]